MNRVYFDGVHVLVASFLVVQTAVIAGGTTTAIQGAQTAAFWGRALLWGCRQQHFWDDSNFRISRWQRYGNSRRHAFTLGYQMAAL